MAQTRPQKVARRAPATTFEIQQVSWWRRKGGTIGQDGLACGYGVHAPSVRGPRRGLAAERCAVGIARGSRSLSSAHSAASRRRCGRMAPHAARHTERRGGTHDGVRRYTTASRPCCTETHSTVPSLYCTELYRTSERRPTAALAVVYARRAIGASDHVANAMNASDDAQLPPGPLSLLAHVTYLIEAMQAIPQLLRAKAKHLAWTNDTTILHRVDGLAESAQANRSSKD